MIQNDDNNDHEIPDNNEINEVSQLQVQSYNPDDKNVAAGVNPGTILTFLKVGAQVIDGLRSGRGFLQTIKEVLWPPAAEQRKWEEFIILVEELITQKIADYAKNDAIAKLKGLQNSLELYLEAFQDWKDNPTNTENQMRLRNQFNITNNLFEYSIYEFAKSGYEVILLPLYAQAANLHLTLLRDVSKYGSQWGMNVVETDDHYNRLKYRIEYYTNHCFYYYKYGLTQAKKLHAPTGDWNKYPWLKHVVGSVTEFQATEDWNLFNDFRRVMILTVLDLVALWPNFDPNHYYHPTSTPLTREVYTNIFGRGGKTVDEVEQNIVRPPDLVRELNEITFFRGITHPSEDYLTPVGSRMSSFKVGGVNRETVVSSLKGKQTNRSNTWDVRYSADNWLDKVSVLRLYEIYSINSEYNGTVGNGDDFGTVWSNPAGFPEHKLSYMSAVYQPPMNGLQLRLGAMTGLSFAARKILDYENTIRSFDMIDGKAIRQITQIPATKAYRLGDNATVTSGAYFNGGDLVKLSSNTSMQLYMRITNGDSRLGRIYSIRVRYACSEDSTLVISKYVARDNTYYETETRSVDRTVSSSDPINMSYSSFKFLHAFEMPANEAEFEIHLKCSKGTIFIDRIEFVPATYFDDYDVVNTSGMVLSNNTNSVYSPEIPISNSLRSNDVDNTSGMVPPNYTNSVWGKASIQNITNNQ